MRRKRLILGVLGGSSLALVAVTLVITTGAAFGQARGQTAPRVTVVNVTIGKPAELSFKLSKFSKLPAGTITFKVKNAGAGTHNFKICTSPTTTSAKNACVGKATKLLKSGASDTLTVTLTKTGKYEYLCTLTGHAAAGMKGLLGVGVAVSASSSTASVTGSSSGTSSSGSTSSSSSTSSPTTGTGGSSNGAGAAAGTPVGPNGDADCAPGTTIAAAAGNNGGDHDDDDTGGPTDADGCL